LLRGVLSFGDAVLRLVLLCRTGRCFQDVGEESHICLGSHQFQAKGLAFLVVPLGGELGSPLAFDLGPTIQLVEVCLRGGVWIRAVVALRCPVFPFVENRPLSIMFLVPAAVLPPVPLPLDVVLRELGQLPK